MNQDSAININGSFTHGPNTECMGDYTFTDVHRNEKNVIMYRHKILLESEEEGEDDAFFYVYDCLPDDAVFEDYLEFENTEYSEECFNMSIENFKYYLLVAKEIIFSAGFDSDHTCDLILEEVRNPRMRIQWLYGLAYDDRTAIKTNAYFLRSALGFYLDYCLIKYTNNFTEEEFETQTENEYIFDTTTNLQYQEEVNDHWRVGRFEMLNYQAEIDEIVEQYDGSESEYESESESESDYDIHDVCLGLGLTIKHDHDHEQECPVCLEEQPDTQKFMCVNNHVFACETCAHSLVNQRVIKCPLCRREY
jgi:hypothetical protein